MVHMGQESNDLRHTTTPNSFPCGKNEISKFSNEVIKMSLNMNMKSKLELDWMGGYEETINYIKKL